METMDTFYGAGDGEEEEVETIMFDDNSLFVSYLQDSVIKISELVKPDRV